MKLEINMGGRGEREFDREIVRAEIIAAIQHTYRYVTYIISFNLCKTCGLYVRKLKLRDIKYLLKGIQQTYLLICWLVCLLYEGVGSGRPRVSFVILCPISLLSLAHRRWSITICQMHV